MYIKAITITDRQSIAEARRNLPSLIREAESGKAVELTRRGEPVAVLISCKHLNGSPTALEVSTMRTEHSPTASDLPRWNSTPASCLEICGIQCPAATYRCRR